MKTEAEDNEPEASATDNEPEASATDNEPEASATDNEPEALATVLSVAYASGSLGRRTRGRRIELEDPWNRRCDS